MHAQKNALKPWQKESWWIPSVSAAFVGRLEDILDLSAEPYAPQYPLVCFDEKLSQLVSEVRQALPVRAGQPVRYDYEYRREGTCNVSTARQTGRNAAKATVDWHVTTATARRQLKRLYP